MTDTPRPDDPPQFGAHEPYLHQPAPPGRHQRRRPAAAGRATLGPLHHSALRRTGAHRDAGRRRLDRRELAGPSHDDAARDLIAGPRNRQRRPLAAGQRVGRPVAERALRRVSHQPSRPPTQLAAILDREIDAAESGERHGRAKRDAALFPGPRAGRVSRRRGDRRALEGGGDQSRSARTIVRRGALQALAVRAFNLSQLNPPRELADPKLEPTLFSSPTTRTPLVRSETAFTLGQIGTPDGARASSKTWSTTPTPTPATTPPSRSPSTATSPRFRRCAEMLDPAEMSSIREEPSEPAQFYKRSLIVTNALEEVEKLATRESVRRLHAGGRSPRIKSSPPTPPPSNRRDIIRRLSRARRRR